MKLWNNRPLGIFRVGTKVQVVKVKWCLTFQQKRSLEYWRRRVESRTWKHSKMFNGYSHCHCVCVHQHIGCTTTLILQNRDYGWELYYHLGQKYPTQLLWIPRWCMFGTEEKNCSVWRANWRYYTRFLCFSQDNVVSRVSFYVVMSITSKGYYWCVFICIGRMHHAICT